MEASSELGIDSSNSSSLSDVGVSQRGRGGRRRAGRGRTGRGGGRAGRRGGRGRSQGREEREEVERFRESDEQRKERVKGLVAQLSEERAKEVLCMVVDGQPGLIYNILDRIDVPQPSGYHPSPDSQTPGWCTCTRCREMPTLPERVCCNQQPENCISQLPDMDQFMLNEGVLALARVYRREVLVYPEDRDVEKANRHASYRQFVMWQHGVLGAGNRRVIPSCVVWRIRDCFPDPFGQYTGFLQSRLG